MDYAIAVLDIGKTNKKVQIYDGALKILDSSYKSFSTIIVDGLDVEDVKGIEDWFKRQLREFGKKYPIKIVSITTHGATGVCVGEDGNPSVPPIAYTNEVDEGFHNEFYRVVGSVEDLQLSTATAEVKPLINYAKLLYFSKKRYPEGFEKTKHVLLYPQYFGYTLTGKAGADYTYVGCHSYLWDFTKQDWSSVTDSLGIRGRLPKRVTESQEILGMFSPRAAEETGLSEKTLVTMGIHDSNSSLVPFLVKEEGDFVLNSTGTWCVAMHPTKKVEFQPDEVGKMIFYNISARNEPVKTSILMGGLEFQTYSNILKKMHSAQDFPSFDLAVYDSAINERSCFIMPGVVKGAGQFPDSDPRVFENGVEYSLEDIKSDSRVPDFFHDYKKAYAVINLSLAIQTKIALERVGLAKGTRIYVEGGFRNNPDYNGLLTAFFPESPVFLTDMKEATAFGAAVIAKAAYEQKDIDELGDVIEIHREPVDAVKFSGLNAYAEEFFKLL